MARTPEERERLVSLLRLNVEYVYDIDGELEYIYTSSGKFGRDTCYTGKAEGFTEYSEAIDYIVDAEEMGRL